MSKPPFWTCFLGGKTPRLKRPSFDIVFKELMGSRIGDSVVELGGEQGNLLTSIDNCSRGDLICGTSSLKGPGQHFQ